MSYRALSDEQVARICYMLQYEIQLAMGDPMPHWDDLPDWMIKGWTDSVRRFELGHTPEKMHDSWCDFMAENGWRYGPERNGEERTHPMMKPLHQLDKVLIAKSHLVQQTIVLLRVTMPQTIMPDPIR
jgi:hypothetical protein